MVYYTVWTDFGDIFTVFSLWITFEIVGKVKGESLSVSSCRAPLAEMDRDDIDLSLQGAVGGSCRCRHSNTDHEDGRQIHRYVEIFYIIRLPVWLSLKMGLYSPNGGSVEWGVKVWSVFVFKTIVWYFMYLV